MKSLIGAFLCLSSVWSAFAFADAELERAQFKAVADAIVTQHKIRSDESIKAIINGGPNSGGSTFVVQYVDAAGKCTQEGVDVFSGEGNKITVTFYRYPRQACK